jgi:hypothetical protein
LQQRHKLGDIDALLRLFDAEIKKIGTKTIVYVIWPTRGSNELDSEGAARYFKEQLRAAEAVGALVAPAGPAWMWATNAGLPTTALYDRDGIHPTPMGTYLAACTLFSAIYGASQSNCARHGTGALSALYCAADRHSIMAVWISNEQSVPTLKCLRTSAGAPWSRPCSTATRSGGVFIRATQESNSIRKGHVL